MASIWYLNSQALTSRGQKLWSVTLLGFGEKNANFVLVLVKFSEKRASREAYFVVLSELQE